MLAAALALTSVFPKEIAGLDWSADGHKIAAISQDGKVRVWTGSGAPIQEIDAGNDGTALALSRDGKILAVGAEDTTLVWWTWNGKEYADYQVRKLTGPISSIAFSSDGATIAAGCQGSGNVFVFATKAAASINVLQELGNGIESVAFSPDGSRLLTGGQNLRLWDYSIRTPMAEIAVENLRQKGIDGMGRAQVWQQSGWTRAVAFSPRGDRLASASVEAREDLGHTRTIVTRYVRSGEVHKTLRFRNIEFTCLDWSADNSAILAGGMGGKVVVADAAFLTVRKFWIVSTGRVTGVAYSPTIDRLATGDSKGFVRIYDRNGLVEKTLLEGEP